MTRETKKETRTKERIVVLEKGNALEIDAFSICCAGSLMPIRAY